jgi:hypothetical protein
LLLPIAAFVVCGCGESYDGREAISGTVTLKGEPLASGGIQFEPLDNQGTNGGSGIANGQFEMEQKYGLKPGRYLVRITSGDGITPVNEPELTGDVPGPTGVKPKGKNTNIISQDLIPPEWSEASKKEIQVKSGQKNEFKFEIPNARNDKKK